ncbi:MULTISPECIES: DUF1292 domain-containing protein [Kosmotoga]|jgi:uncharacterized protein YrzB (UPF0473 family)|uniref:DUF1292 domain-containing protein n=1 Tax=Kosmotoga olearia (strain ATCC BAA-1733 / DSM 21960 / TBF 19.5.1) TaxID=521045 RepID=C5CIA4_KOSOT|nr:MULTISPECIES: DUF1292 domain-containing protein [Kosmotoga]ACR80806.1 hypothetical protein Kole_2129 [Kosmotoga olearia TBF 19.5.1]MDK2952710.1 hypothetical protein [Kosmotoga sp.]
MVDGTNDFQDFVAGHDSNGHEHLEMFAITDEAGQEHNFALIEQFEHNGGLYWVCQEAFFEDDDKIRFDEESFVVFKAEQDDDGNLYLNSLEDEEFESFQKAWEASFEEEEEEEN